MKSDTDVRRDVEAELKWSPELDEKDIAVKVNDGVVALSGFARNLFEKHHAEVVVKRVTGVAAVANDIEVRRNSDDHPTDPELARIALAAIQHELPMSWDKIQPVVHEGRLFLEGTVEWNYQRERAESAVRKIKGVCHIRNSVKVKPMIPVKDIKQKIEEAFQRSAEFDSRQVTVDTAGSEVILRGEVRSWAERDQAQASAWSAPGVTQVHNEISVRV
jgi:osmotically-inducible protein OsmY